MITRSIWIVLALAASAHLAAPVQAQYIPPHSNDPHPPANQPSYQLPNPLARPGIGGYPGAAHSNDPHYSRTESQPSWPRTMAVPGGSSSSYEAERRRQRRTTVPSAPLVSVERATPPNKASGRPSASRAHNSATSLQQCYRNWDSSTRMSRSAWDSTCRRLAADGRVGVR